MPRCVLYLQRGDRRSRLKAQSGRRDNPQAVPKQRDNRQDNGQNEQALDHAKTGAADATGLELPRKRGSAHRKRTIKLPADGKILSRVQTMPCAHRARIDSRPPCQADAVS